MFTPDKISGSTGSDWASHKIIGEKPRGEMLGPKLKKYKFEIVLDATLGMQPRVSLALMHKMVEEGRVEYFIVGFLPVGMCRYRMTDVSEEWDCVISGGRLVRCRVEISLEEYV